MLILVAGVLAWPTLVLSPLIENFLKKCYFPAQRAAEQSTRNSPAVCSHEE